MFGIKLLKSKVAELSNTWQSMDTAPMDGTEILVRVKDRPEGQHCAVVWWDDKVDGWLYLQNDEISIECLDTLTAWMPVPPKGE